jgi:hypothetical protein
LTPERLKSEMRQDVFPRSRHPGGSDKMHSTMLTAGSFHGSCVWSSFLDSPWMKGLEENLGRRGRIN